VVIARSRLTFRWQSGSIALLVGLFVVALAVRVLRMYPEFYSSDMILATSLVTDAVPGDGVGNLWPEGPSTGGMAGNPLLVLSYTYSPLTAAMMLANVLLLDRLGVVISETVWLLPTLASGAGTVVLAYALGRQFIGRWSGIICAAFLLILPIHVWQSRYPAAGDTLGFLVQGLALLAMIRYMDTDRRAWALAAGLLLGLSFFANLQWPGMLPVLGYAVFVTVRDCRDLPRRVYASFGSLWRWEILLPSGLGFLVLLGTGLLIGRYQGQLLGGPLGYFTAKMGMGQLDFHVPFYAGYAPSETGPVLAGLFPLFLVLGAVEAARLRRSSILWFWSVCFVFPYWFFVGPKTTSPPNYYGPGLQAMALYVAVRLAEWLEAGPGVRRRLSLLAVGAVLISSVYTTLITAYGLGGLNALNLAGRTGMFVSSQGFKASGYWLRENTPRSARVFAFDYGGLGLEPSVASYYFDRPTTAMYDAADFAAMSGLLYREATRANYLVIRPNDYERLEAGDKALHAYLLAEIRSQEGQTLMQIYGRDQGKAPDLVDDQIAAQAFDIAFGHLSSLRAERKLALEFGLPDD